jgi:hypothetical protein
VSSAWLGRLPAEMGWVDMWGCPLWIPALHTRRDFAPKLTCNWPMRWTKIHKLQLINFYKWHTGQPHHLAVCTTANANDVFYTKCENPTFPSHESLNSAAFGTLNLPSALKFHPNREIPLRQKLQTVTTWICCYVPIICYITIQW